jgi:uncharacterized membrane protein YcjF (UPF0283 family)
MPGLKLARLYAARIYTAHAAQARAPRRSSMRRTVMAVLGLLIGYPLFAVAGDWIIQMFAGNSFDRSMETNMIAVFAIGPAGAVIGLVVGMVLGGKSRVPEMPPATEDI